MPIVCLYKHPFKDELPEVIEHESIGLWLIEYFGETPAVHISVFRGEPSQDTDVTGNVDELLKNDAEYYTVLLAPGGADPASAFLFLQAVFTVFSIVSTLGNDQAPNNLNRAQQSPNNFLGNRSNSARVGQRIPDIFGTVLSTPDLLMPTYNYYDHTGNKFERGAYCIGKGYFHVNAVDILDGLLTPLQTIANAKLSMYGPYTIPTGSGGVSVLDIGGGVIEPIETHIPNTNVGGIILKAPNQANTTGIQDYWFSGNQIVQYARTPAFLSVYHPTDTLSITMNDYIVNTTARSQGYPAPGSIGTTAITGVAPHTFQDTGNVGVFYAAMVGQHLSFTSGGVYNGSYHVTSYSVVLGIPQITVTETIASNTDSTIVSWYMNFSGNYVVDTVAEVSVTIGSTTAVHSRITLTTSLTPFAIATNSDFGYDGGVGTNSLSGNPNYISATVLNTVGTATEWSNWLVFGNVDQTKLLVNFWAANGVYTNAGAGNIFYTVTGEYQVQQLVAGVPTGTVYDQTVTLSSNTGVYGDINLATGSSSVFDLSAHGIPGPVQLRARRQSVYDYNYTGSITDQIQLEAVYSIEPVTVPNFGNISFFYTDTQLNQQAASSVSRVLNAVVSRKIPTWNGSAWSGVLNSDGTIASGTLNTSSKVIDIVAAVSQDIKIGRRVLSTDVDISQIYTIQGELDSWDATCGQFNYTFDSYNTSYEETVAMIANAAFCIAYRQNGFIRFSFNQAQSVSTALLCHRNKKPNSDTVSRNFASYSDNDGVELTYQDSITLVTEVIRLPLTLNYNNPKKIEISGVRNFNQAWYRAYREYMALTCQRQTIETSTTMSARALLPNQRVDIVDNTRYTSYDGEVVGQVGMVLILSRDVLFTVGTHTILLTRRDGSVQSIVVTPGAASNKVVMGSSPTEAIVTVQDPTDGSVQTAFSFASDSVRQAQAYKIQTIGFTDSQYAKVTAINYSPLEFSGDTLPIPSRPVVIGAL